MRSRKLWVVGIGCLAVAAAVGGPLRNRFAAQPYTGRNRAFFMDSPTVQFVRPGLVITVQSASIASDGTISTTYMVTDPKGLPLDRAGVTTPGVVTTSFIAAYIPEPGAQYTSYTTRTASGAAVSGVTQAAADSGGTYTQIGTGQYTYTFKTKAPAGFNAAATTTIGIYGNRDLTTFGLTKNFASTEFNFVPNGSPVVYTRDVISNESCNRCHDELSHHGGQRRGIELCVLCHTPQSTDANSGNTVDLKVMVHKIHMGASLPSVKAGKPYVFGTGTGAEDFSDVVFPADTRRCTVCHAQNTGAAQATAFLTNPTRAVCGSCHDDVNFGTGANHPGGAYPDDSKCSTCHLPTGPDFSASIAGAHVVPTDSSLLSGLILKIGSVTNGTAGSKPVVNFTVRDKNGNGVQPSALGSLSMTMSGPTADYGYTSFGSDAATEGYVSESALKAASCAPDGSCSYTFTHTVPAGASGTFAIGMEARRSETILSGTSKQQTVTYGAFNPVSYFSVDGSTVSPRRQVVATANCNQCHVDLSLHGNLRHNTEYCVLCHNPSHTDASARASAVNPADKTLPPQGLNFNLLVHRVHFGPNAAADGAKNPYIVVGFGGSHNDLSDTRFPQLSPTGTGGDTRNCAVCHVNNSQLNLPIGKNPVLDPQGWINPNQAVASACGGCHTSKPEASHFLSNTTSLGEACTVCHSSGAIEAVDKVHAQY